MKFLPSRFCVTCALLAMSGTAAMSALAQSSDASACIFAGRLNSEGRWAPLATGVTLLNAAGQPVTQQGKASLENTTAVRLSKTALLARCHGNQALPSGEIGAGSKSPAPVVSAGSQPIPITSVAYAPIRGGSAGGQWVELKLDLPAGRVMLVQR